MSHAAIPALFATCLLAACSSHPVRVALVDGAHVASDAAWQRLDTDGDGALSRAEIEQQHAVALQEDLDAADADGDGRVSRAEFDAWWPVLRRSPVPESLARLNASSAR